VLFPPVLGVAPVAWNVHRVAKKNRDTERLLRGPLSRATFDPTVIPDLPRETDVQSVYGRLDVEQRWTPVVYARGFDGYSAFGSNEASDWSTVVDRRERAGGVQGAPVPLELDTFVADIVHEVVSNDEEVSVVRTARDLALVRRNSLPESVPAFDNAMAQQAHLPFRPNAILPPRLQQAVVMNQVIESVNLENGAIVWSVVRWRSQGPLLGVQWVTFIRSSPASGVYLGGKYINPDNDLREKEEAAKVIDEAGSFGEWVTHHVPKWCWTIVFLVPILCGIWGLLWATSFGTIEVWGRVSYVALLVWWALHAWWVGRRPFPRALWPSRNLWWTERRERRKQRVRDAVRKAWKVFDYSSPMPVSKTHGAIMLLDRLDREANRFLTYCQDRLIQDAIIRVAERHGIDMAKFKEGIQQINNYGVIASHIDGPVAAGNNATAKASTATNTADAAGPKPEKAMAPAWLKRTFAKDANP
jgi:hypothetical protein